MADKGFVVVRNLTLTVLRGQNLLVTGPSGCGKTSFLRGVAGLWRPIEGSAMFRSVTAQCYNLGAETFQSEQDRGEDQVGHGSPCKMQGGAMFLPQRPYLFRGTLLEQVTYPSKPDTTVNQEVETILIQLGLSHLLFEKHMRGDVLGEEEEESVEVGKSNGNGLSVARDWPSVLSPGECQRIGLARVLFHRP
ncbi:unnamed protein product, partial [Choristocarpus tenellus]